MPAFSRAFVDNTDASGTGTFHHKCRFMSAQRRKKTRSAASRYRRYVRLTSTTGELRLQLIKCQSKKEESKDTLSEKSVQSVGVRVHTPPRLHSLRLRLGFGELSLHSVAGDCGDSKKLRRLRRPSLYFARPLRATAACSLYQRPL